jgi:recombination protein RecA
MSKESSTKTKNTEKNVPSKEKEVKPIHAEKAESGSKAAARDTALKNTLAQIEKQYGKGSIMQMDESLYAKIEGIPTGSLSLDIALGGSGIPRGRICEFFGPESSGKTTLALHVIANAQKLGGICAFIDAEHALDTTWAKRLGVDISSLLVSQPDTGEQALDIAEMLVKSNAVDVIVIDSVAALVPAAEMAGDMGASHVGLQARLMSQAMRKLTGIISKSKTSVIFINQIRMKIGVMFGNPETTAGGNALKFYCSVRIDVRRMSTIKDNEQAVGNHVKAKVVKNKMAPPFREAEFDIMFNKGISYEGDLLDLGGTCDVVEKSGAWLNYGSIRLGQGRENAKLYLEQNPDVTKEIRQQIMFKKGLVAA